MHLYEKGLGYQKHGELEARQASLDAEKEQKRRELNALAQRLLPKDEQQERLTLAKRIARRYRAALQKKTFQLKKEIIQALVKQITIYPDGIRAELMITREDREHGTVRRLAENLHKQSMVCGSEGVTEFYILTSEFGTRKYRNHRNPIEQTR